MSKYLFCVERWKVKCFTNAFKMFAKKVISEIDSGKAQLSEHKLAEVESAA